MVTRRGLVLGTAGLVLAPRQTWAQHAFETAGLHRTRATVPVRINGVGALRFAVDTAANCSVIADDLIERLALTPAGELGMHTLVGREVVPAVLATTVSSGALDSSGVRLAVGRRSAMAGLDGLLGCDLLINRKLILNFKGQQRARIARSRAQTRGFLDPIDPSTRLISAGERRFLSMLMIQARVGSSRALAIVDSGAHGTILNQAAARAGRAVPLVLNNGETTARVQSPTGRATVGRPMMLRSLGFAGVSITDLPVVTGDFHTFGIWGLSDVPAMLIGLDILSMFESVSIDLKRNEFSVHV